MLEQLWNSTQQFHEKFGTKNNEYLSFHRAFAGESAELIGAFYSAFDLNEVAEEGADVLVTMIGILQKSGVSYLEFLKAIEKVIEKNDVKNHDTHFVNKNGVVVRR